MERPNTWIVGIVLQDQITRRGGRARLHELHVTALGVLLMGDGSVPSADAFGQHIKVVAVQVHRVGGGKLVVHDYAHGAVVTKVVDVPFWVLRVGEVALVGEHEERMVVVGAEGDAVHVEEVVACFVGAEGDVDFLRDGWVGGGGEGEEGDGGGEGIVAAFAVIVGSCG